MGYQGDNRDKLQLEKEFQAATNLLVGTVLKKYISREMLIFLEEVNIQLIADKQSLQFDCPSGTVAARLLKMVNAISLAIYGLKENLQLRFIPRLEILCAGQQFIPRINPEKLLRDSFMTASGENQSGTNIVMAELDLDLNELYRDRYAIYITQMSDQKVLFANRAALASNNRTAGEMVGKEVTALWDDEVLSELMTRLERDGELLQYNYPGYRWSRELNSPIWRRDRYMFVANYKLVEFLGSVCRFCTITNAEKIQSPLAN